MRADVCIISEGAYPYVTGGVSSWVHQLMSELPDIRFAVFHIGAKKGLFGERKYELPPNVVAFSEAYLMGEEEEIGRRSGRFPDRALSDTDRFIRLLGKGEIAEAFSAMPQLLGHFMGREGGLTTPLGRLMRDRRFWELIKKIYRRRAPEESFLDYFWTFMASHESVFRIMDAFGGLPEAAVYHTVSTGYAGLLAAMAKALRGGSVLLTEHGIYVKERKLEISQTDWIYEDEDEGANKGELSYFRRMWIRMFLSLGRITYEASDVICTLFEGNRKLQVQYGADPEKILVVPNGIWPDRFAELRNRERDRPPTVVLLGRVVPIKDIKTFIKAVKLVSEKVPGLRALIVGPEDEEPDYAKGCHDLVRVLNLEEVVVFTGRRDIKRVFPQVDVLALTSISEGLPLVILEAAACGIPSVATDVGACRELIEGRTPEDRALGPSGIVTPLMSPADTAAALTKLLTDRSTAERMGRTALERVTRFYHQKNILRQYLDLYRVLMGKKSHGRNRVLASQVR